MLRLDAVSFVVRDPWAAARFWATLLERPLEQEANSVRVEGDDRQPALRFVADSTRTDEPALIHLHVTSTDADDRQRLLTRSLSAGASHLDVGQLPEEKHTVLADPVGNAFCVIEPGNNWLAGCGLFGEVACDGTRDVGVFWSRALDWPLVWDSDGETAIQSPAGGTKIAWGGPPVEKRTGGRRQRFDLVSDDLESEIVRLRELGATKGPDSADDATSLLDPDGNDFRIRRA